jgi:hypothetical protein
MPLSTNILVQAVLTANLSEQHLSQVVLHYGPLKNTAQWKFLRTIFIGLRTNTALTVTLHE